MTQEEIKRWKQHENDQEIAAFITQERLYDAEVIPAAPNDMAVKPSDFLSGFL